MGQSEKEKNKAPQPIVVVAVVVVMSKEVELEAFGHERVLEERDLRFLEEREEALSFGRERKLGECFRRVGGIGF